MGAAHAAGAWRSTEKTRVDLDSSIRVRTGGLGPSKPLGLRTRTDAALRGGRLLRTGPTQAANRGGLLLQKGLPLRGVWALTSLEVPQAVPDGPPDAYA